jgi:hypothetical protein
VSLIDGVITAGEQVGVQCLQFVNNVTGGGGSGYSTAGALEQSAASSGKLHSVPQLGDIAVWGPGANGAAGAGHAGIVTGLQNGLVQVTGTNWPGGAGATQYTVGKGNNPVGMGLPSGFIDPTTVGGKNIITGAPSESGAVAAATAAGTSITSGSTYQTLSSLTTGASAVDIPSKFILWLSQGTLVRRLVFTAGGVFLAWYGLHLLAHVDSPVQVVTSAAKAVA